MRMLCIAAALALAPAAQAQIYKWVDEKGRTHYEERPPEGKDPKEARKMTAPKDAPKSGGADWKKQELEFKQRQTQRSEADTAAERKRAQREAACAQARDRLENASQRGRFYTTDEKGERHYRSDEEQAAIVEAERRKVQESCD